jgi:adenosylcobinamide hydrolase
MTATLVAPATATYRDGDGARPALLWHLPEPMLGIASAPVGGGIGPRRWIVNVQVPLEYARLDLEAHLAAVARELGCAGPGIGFLTAASVDGVTSAVDGGVAAYATVGLRHPTQAAAPDDEPRGSIVGTINLVVGVPVRLTHAALVNAVVTATEAKAQALREHDVAATGTASDAICVVCPALGTAEQFAGPRSPIGACLARAVHTAVSAGTVAWSRRQEPAS